VIKRVYKSYVFVITNQLIHNSKVYKFGESEIVMEKISTKLSTILGILTFILIFLLGFFSANFIEAVADYTDFKTEIPFLNDFILNSSGNENVSAPSDSVSEDDVKVYEDRVVIYIDDASLSRYAPTGSMIPVLDENSNGIRIKINSADEINIGDIISFYSGEDLIIHRVIEKGTDEKGVYFITKGDNNPVSDGKMRIEDIEYKTVGMIW